MASKLLNAVEAAVSGDDSDSSRGEEHMGAHAPHPTKETDMSKDNQPAGGAIQQAGITQAEHDAAVKSARDAGKAEGRAEGAKEATDRLAAVIGAEGIKGNATRISAAADLAIKSPGMSSTDVIAFVAANVTATPAVDASAYADRRIADAGLSQPKSPAAAADAVRSGWAKTAETINNRR